jgi:hypothetical protein
MGSTGGATGSTGAGTGSTGAGAATGSTGAATGSAGATGCAGVATSTGTPVGAVGTVAIWPPESVVATDSLAAAAAAEPSQLACDADPPDAVAPPPAVMVAPVGPPAAPALAVARLAADARAGLLPFRYGAGSWASAFTRVSKCRWGPVQLPVQPT